MIEILFRAKATNRIDGKYYRTKYKNGDWVYGLLTKTNSYYNLAEMTNTDGISGIDVTPETIGRFIGKTDKNGKKIFEGDIVKVTYTEKRKSYGIEYDWEFSCVEQVIYVNEQACFMLKINNDGVIIYRPIHNFQEHIKIKEMEVIGNIYDNPELLTEE